MATTITHTVTKITHTGTKITHTAIQTVQPFSNSIISNSTLDNSTVSSNPPMEAPSFRFELTSILTIAVPAALLMIILLALVCRRHRRRRKSLSRSLSYSNTFAKSSASSRGRSQSTSQSPSTPTSPISDISDIFKPMVPSKPPPCGVGTGYVNTNHGDYEEVRTTNSECQPSSEYDVPKTTNSKRVRGSQSSFSVTFAGSHTYIDLTDEPLEEATDPDYVDLIDCLEECPTYVNGPAIQPNESEIYSRPIIHAT
uniref:Uncharacterized protein n=1 Tax=Biomphalaria glabrata TaxID=6526 RepID=A0A2C9KX25_BIOGL